MIRDQLINCFDQCGPDGAQKERMWRNMKNRTEQKRGRTLPRWSRMAVAAALSVCLLGTTAYAAQVTGLDRRLLELLGAGEQAEALIAGAQVVDKTVKSKGSALTVREVVGSGENLYILLNFTAPQGTALDAYDYRFGGSSHITFDDRNGWSFSGYTKLEDNHPTDNSVDLVLRVTSENIPAAGTATLEVEDLEKADGYGERYVSLGLPGRWKVSFPLEYADCAKTRRELWEPVTLYGQEAVVTEVSLSPLSVTVKGVSGALEELIEAAQDAEYGDWLPVTLHFRDGTSYTTGKETGDGYGSMMGRSYGGFYTNWTFHQVIDPDQVEAVEFYGVEIPME